MATSAAPAALPKGIDYSLPNCGEILCNGHGTCVPPLGEDTQVLCECALGYRGQFCEETVNGALSVPLTVSVIAVILGLLILAFIVAKMRQRQKRYRRSQLARRQGYNIAV